MTHFTLLAAGVEGESDLEEYDTHEEGYTDEGSEGEDEDYSE